MTLRITDQNGKLYFLSWESQQSRSNWLAAFEHAKRVANVLDFVQPGVTKEFFEVGSSDCATVLWCSAPVLCLCHAVCVCVRERERKREKERERERERELSLVSAGHGRAVGAFRNGDY